MGQSVNLTRHGVNIDELRAEGWEPTADSGTFQETETDAGCEDDRVIAMLSKLQEINAAKPLALSVLLHSAVGGMNLYDTANAMGVHWRTVSNRRKWLLRHCGGVAACMKGVAKRR